MTTSSDRLSIQPKRLKDLLSSLLDIYSPSGKEEEILQFLETYLKAHGVSAIRQNVDEGRYNLVVMPPETDVSLALIAHVDTVPAYDYDRFGCEEQGDLILGLGAADMKSGCAAMIEAYLTLVENVSASPLVALVLVVGEEEDGDGSRKLVRDYHFPWALIGEPTNLRPCLGHYGYLELEITTWGKRMHASLARQGENPIENMLRFLLRLTRYIETDRPEIVYNIRDLSSSQTGFTVPDRCNAWVDLHLPPTAPTGEITVEIDELLVMERREHPDFKGSLRFTNIHPGYELPEKGTIVEALIEVYLRSSILWEPEDFRSHSDANLLWAAGVKPILMGPGHLEKAHAPDESVSFKQVREASQLYLDLLVSLSRDRNDTFSCIKPPSSRRETT